VAIATGLTAIYPWESPGGWHLIGRCPVPLFDARRGAPSLLSPGDRVRFAPVSDAEYRRVSTDVGNGTFDPSLWRDDGAREAR
jgi:allophanate hydrolase subunit 1